MQDINVVVTFCSRTGATEEMALAAAVGAVQARGNIRLRWLREAAEAEEAAGHRARMSQEYVAPRDTDAEWADVWILAVPARLRVSAPELKDHLDWLKSRSRFSARVAAAFVSGSDSGSTVLPELYGALAELGCIVVPHAATSDPREAARLHGRRATEIARALRHSIS